MTCPVFLCLRLVPNLFRCHPELAGFPPILVLHIDPLAFLKACPQVVQLQGGALKAPRVQRLERRQQAHHVVSQVGEKTFCFVVENLLIIEELAYDKTRFQHFCCHPSSSSSWRGVRRAPGRARQGAATRAASGFGPDWFDDDRPFIVLTK
jgi:hypothetical protein